MAHSDISRNVE